MASADRFGREMSAAALDVFGVPNSLDTPIGAIGTEGAVEGRATGMDGSGVFLSLIHI